MLHRGPAMPASPPLAVCAEPGWLLGLSMTSAFLLHVGRSPRGCRNLVNHEYFWSDSSRVCMRLFLPCLGGDSCLVAGGDVVPGDGQPPKLSLEMLPATFPGWRRERGQLSSWWPESLD